MRKKKRDCYQKSVWTIFWQSGAELLIVLLIILLLVVLVVVVIYNTSDDIVYPLSEYAGLPVPVIVLMVIVSYAYPFIGVIRLKKQEYILKLRYKDRTDFELKPEKRDWFVCRDNRLSIYHRNYISRIIKKEDEKRESDTTNVKVYLLHIENCVGKQERITFIFKSDRDDFERWLKVKEYPEKEK